MKINLIPTPIKVLSGLLVACVVLSAGLLNSSPSVRALQIPTPTPGARVLAPRSILLNGGLVTGTVINGPSKPPAGYDIQRRPVSLLSVSASLTSNILTAPAFSWVYGCSAVSGAMIAGYYDRNGYPNMYSGPTNGGVMPLDNSSWPTWSDGSSSYRANPLVASRNGVDGQVGRGSIDDSWVAYGSAAADPYITNAWVQHTFGSAIGDYMWTSQSAFGNTDGSTTFWNYNSSARLTCDAMVSYGLTDGTLGRKRFYEARGYTVTDCYNQKTDNIAAGGFSYAQYMAEIDAGRPVMLNLTGHTVVGVGYDSSTNLVYIHDTWDYSNHSMTWGGVYISNMQLQSVSIVNLAANGATATPVPPTATKTNTPVPPTVTPVPPTATPVPPTATLVPPTATDVPPSPTATALPDATVILAALPGAGPLHTGDSFDLLVQVQAGQQSVDGAAAYLDFDPTVLAVTGISEGADLPSVLQNSFDNDLGSIDYAAGNLSAPYPQGTFSLMTVHFTTLASSAGSEISFANVQPRRSETTFGGNSTFYRAENATVVIEASTALNGSVDLEGRAAAPDPSWESALTVGLTVPGEIAPLYTFTTTSDSMGSFRLEGFQPGFYDIRVKGSHSLQNLATLELLDGENGVYLGSLSEGDANDDNSVSLIDFSLLAGTFSGCLGDAGFDARADFNQDGCVDMLDFSLLATHFDEIGAANADGGIQTSAAPSFASGPVGLSLAPAALETGVGQVFQVDVLVEAGDQAVDAAQVGLVFDPAVLQVTGLYDGGTLPNSLLSRYDNSAGTIEYAAGMLSNFPTGTFTLLTIEFEAIAPSAGSSLSLQGGMGLENGATYGGASVLGATNDGLVVVASLPGDFDKSRPLNGGSVNATPVLSWGSSSGASGYELCFGQDPTCVDWQPLGNVTSYAPAGLVHGNSYSWQVRAVNSAGSTTANAAAPEAWSFTVDAVPPVVSSITRADPNPSIAGSLRYTVTFSEPVSGVNAADFGLLVSDLTGTSILSVSGNGSTYLVTVGTGSGTGTLQLRVKDDDSIRDAAGNRLGGTGTGSLISGPKYTLDRNSQFNSVAGQDGWLLETSELSVQGGGLNLLGNLQVGDDSANRQFRSLISFNTAGIPDNAVIVRVSLKIYKSGFVGTDPFRTHGALVLDIKNGFFGTSNLLQTVDFQATPTKSAINSFAPMSSAAGWYQVTMIPLNFPLINKSGTTQFRLRFGLDDNNDRGADYAIFSAGDGPLATRPVLVVEYTLP
jgi:hypothetical protein